MPLTSSAAARFGTQMLVNLTNPFTQAPTTIDNTRLVNAANDTQGRFEAIVGIPFVDGNIIHDGPAVTGVLCYLLKRSGKAGQVMKDT